MHRAPQWPGQASQDPQQGGLARPIGAEEQHQFSTGNVKINAAERRDGAEPADEGSGGDEGIG
jgi:hypothetical protein